VIDLLLNLMERVPCTFLRGNHEALMLDYLERGEFEIWRMNGGLDTLSSYRTRGGTIEIPEDHIEFIHDTKLFFETDDFIFVHAGLRPELSVAENVLRNDDHVFLWERGHLDARKVKWEKVVVCGHTPHSRPINHENLILIDTGCVYHRHPDMGTLTGVRLPEREFISVAYQG
jgi:serine/threonine protein phosphatase 1